MRISVPFLLLLAFLAPPAPAHHDAPAAQVYIVRHAEKESGDDPALTAAGAARAQALATLLRDAGITRIFSTDYRRTRDTAAPLAAALGVAIELYDPRAQDTFAAQLRDARETVLVVGHSNTIDRLAGLLGADPGEPVDEATEYDRLYVITLGADGVRGEMRRYGNTL